MLACGVQLRARSGRVAIFKEEKAALRLHSHLLGISLREGYLITLNLSSPIRNSTPALIYVTIRGSGGNGGHKKSRDALFFALDRLVICI